MKKKIGICTLFMASAALMLGAFSYQANLQINKAEAASTVDAQLTSVQIRSGGSRLNYLVILDDLIDVAGGAMSIPGRNYNAPSHINLYMEPNGDAISLADVIDSTRNWDINIWTSGGIMFPISDDNYEIYNGTTVYAIEVLEGCTYPDSNFNKAVVSETVKFINGSYGDPDAKNEAFTWNKSFAPSGEDILIASGQVRADPEHNFYCVALVSSSFSGVPAINYPNLYELTAYNKIKLYLSETDEGKYLSEITSMRAGCQNRWDSSAFLFDMTAEEYEIYNGTTTYKMVIEEGCQLVLNNELVNISDTYTLVNINYGDPTCRNGAFYFLPHTEPITDPIALFDAQVRADADCDFFFIDIRSELYTNTPQMFYDNFEGMNTYSHVRIYRSPDDEGTLLSDVTSLRSAYQNVWGSEAFMFSLTAQEYEIWNGTTIYMIEVLEGCQLYVNDYVGATGKAYRFINNDWGKPEAKYQAFNFTMANDPLKNLGEVEISWIHNRMDNVSGYRWLMFIVNDEFFDTSVNVSAWMNELNMLDSILIYFSDDGEPVPLSEMYEPNTTGVALRMFGDKTMFAASISNEKVDGQYRYCGPKMYRITIPAGTQIPTYESGVAGYRVVQKDISFINHDYGKYGEIPGEFDDEGNPRLYEEWSINWKVEVAGLENLGEIGISGIHNRMDKESGYRWIMIVLDQSIYNVGLDVSDWMDEVNLMDNISIYFNEYDDPIKIKDIYDPTTTGVAIQLFGQKNIIAISISNEIINGHYRYGGPEMYKIVVETGTQIPTYENGVAGYREILEKTVLLNDDYQLYGEIPDTMDDYGNPRLYEEWNVNWSVASCYVTFTVLGIEGVSYPDMLLEYGERISLKEFAIDGYDLVATTSAGDTIYQCIIGSNRNLDVILTYSVHKDEGGDKKGCGGNIAAGSIVIVMTSLSTVLFIVRKRKENEA